MREYFLRIFFYSFCKDFSPISRYPDKMVFRFVDSMCSFSKSHTSLYQIPSRLDSHYITRLESGVLCGSIIAFTPSTCYIYHAIFWQYRILFCLANSSRLHGLICSSCSSGRSFAYSFLQISPHDGHPCCSANGCYAPTHSRLSLPAIIHARRTRYTRASPWHFKTIQASLDLNPGVFAILRILI